MTHACLNSDDKNGNSQYEEMYTEKSRATSARNDKFRLEIPILSRCGITSNRRADLFIACLAKPSKSLITISRYYPGSLLVFDALTVEHAWLISTMSANN